MERFISWNIRVWIAIHVAFTLTQLVHTPTCWSMHAPAPDATPLYPCSSI